MTTEILQTIVVTLAALAAAAVVVRRVFPSSASRAGQEGCAGCPSAGGGCGTKRVPETKTPGGL
jgi:hypothetical protein